MNAYVALKKVGGLLRVIKDMTLPACMTVTVLGDGTPLMTPAFAPALRRYQL